MIQPDNVYKSVWDLGGLFIILYQAILIPYRISFEVDARGFFGVLETLFDIYFMLDIALNFFTGLEIKGKVILNHKIIIFKYLVTWFLLDLLATFPFSWVVDEDPNRFYVQSYQEGSVSLFTLGELICSCLKTSQSGSLPQNP